MSSEARVLGREEFVRRMLARKASQRANNAEIGTKTGGEAQAVRKAAKRARKSPRLPGDGSERRGSTPRPVVRDDGKFFRTLTEALEAAGYAPGGCTTARDRIDAGRTWKDGHVYAWSEVGERRETKA